MPDSNLGRYKTHDFTGKPLTKRQRQAVKAADLIGLFRDAVERVDHWEPDSIEWKVALEIVHKRGVDLMRALVGQKPTDEELQMFECCSFPDDDEFFKTTVEKRKKDPS